MGLSSADTETGQVTIVKEKQMHLVNLGGYCWKKLDSL